MPKKPQREKPYESLSGLAQEQVRPSEFESFLVPHLEFQPLGRTNLSPTFFLAQEIVTLTPI